MTHRTPTESMQDAWERATTMEDPLLALGAVRELEADLRWWTLTLLREALDEGSPWADVAAALGIEPQRIREMRGRE